jgi:MarR family transcriptional regulator, lower aerobic nicotinate degradation pathway regulator
MTTIPAKTKLPYRTQPLPPALHPSLWDCTGFALQQCARAGDTLFAQRLEPLNLTPPLFAILLLIEADGSLLQARIGEVLAINKATVVALVDALESAGLAKRQPNPDDARSVFVQLQPKAHRVIKLARQVELESRNQLMATLDAQEQATLHALLCKVAQGLGLVSEGGESEIRDRT